MGQPSNVEGQRLNLRIKFRSDNLDNFVERYGADVSSGGIFIRSKTPLDVGAKVSFTLALMDGTAVFVGEGTVAWARKPESDTPGGNPGMGIRFDVLSDESRAKLTQILEMKAALEKTGKPVVRGPTPIPEPDAAFGSRDATAKVRLTQDGRIVRDMPEAPAPAPAATAPAPSQPYAASFSNPTGRAASPVPSDTEATQVTAPPTHRVPRNTPAIREDGAATQRLPRATASLREDAQPTERLPRPTPSLREDAPQPFGPSKTATNTPPLRTGGGDVVRVNRPSVAPEPGTEATARVRVPTPAFGAPPTTRPPGSSPFGSTMAFGQAPRVQPGGSTPAPARPATPAPDLLRRATPPPMPVAQAPAVFSRPTPVPAAPLNEHRTGARSGPVVARPSASRPAVAAPPAAKAAWGEDKTEIVEDVPRFDEIEEKTTTVRGQALPSPHDFQGGPAGGFGNDVATRPALTTQPLPQGGLDEFAHFPDTPKPTRESPIPSLGDLFEGEPLPGTADPGPLLDNADAVAEFSRNDSSARGSRYAPMGHAPGTSMIARRAETTDYVEGKRRRGILWAALGAVVVGTGVWAFVEYGPLPPSADRATLVAHPVEVPAAAPEPVAPGELAAPAAPAVAQEPAAAAPEQPPPAAVAAKPDPAPAAAPAAKPAPVAAKPTPAPRAAAPARPAPKPRAQREVAAAVPATPGEAADENAIYWLRVRSVPAGADVFLDGETEGPTPFQRRIFDPTRAYALSVRKEGYEPHERMISASDAWVKIRGEYQLTITVKLRKLAGAGAAAAPEGEASTGERAQEPTPETKPEPSSAPVLDP